jgi:tRNA nucleotidyltransferase (CCA-adding enzyme)
VASTCGFGTLMSIAGRGGDVMGAAETGWEHFAHDADVGIRGFGPTREAAFEQAALALTHVIADAARVEPRELVEVRCDATDSDILLVDWLNALVFEMATRAMLFGRFEVQIEGARLYGKAWGERVDVARHEPSVEVKGATYTALAVRRRDNGTWTAQCVVDV